jgi:hypothetical protein
MSRAQTSAALARRYVQYTSKIILEYFWEIIDKTKIWRILNDKRETF